MKIILLATLAWSALSAASPNGGPMGEFEAHGDVGSPKIAGYSTYNAASQMYTLSAGGTWPGYIPDLRSAAYGGYGADASTRIEVGAGEKIVLRHLTFLYELLGMWKDRPGPR